MLKTGTKTKTKFSTKTINVFDKAEIKTWCLEFNCTKEELINAVLTAGKSAKKVKEFLKHKEK